MKNKKVILSSILSLVLCLSLIVGGTFALFTSTTQTNISINSGKVEVVATVTDLALYSHADIDMNTEAGTKTYVTDTFLNGGTATYAEGTLTLDKLTPGDGVEFNISVANNSNVAIKYRVLISGTTGDSKLMEGLAVTIDGKDYAGAVNGDWTDLEAAGTIPAIPVTIELPTTAGNEYQDLTVALSVAVEAVQGNAVEHIDVYDPTKTEEVTLDNVIDSAAEFVAFADAVNAGDTYAGETVTLATSIDLNNEAWTAINNFAGTFDGQGYTISNIKNASLFGTIAEAGVVKNLNLKDVSIEGALHMGGFLANTLNGKAEYCTVKNATANSTYKGFSGLVGFSGVTAVIDHCSVDNYTLTVTNTEDNGDKTGGLVGQSSGTTITNSTVSNITLNGVYKTKEWGGFVGRHANNGTIENCTATNVTINVSDYAQSVGGFVGAPANATIKNCDVNGVTIKVNNCGWVGGFAGYIGDANTYDFDDCNVTGMSITLETDAVSGIGGFCGRSAYTLTIKNCSVEGTIDASDAAIATGKIKALVGYDRVDQYPDIMVTENNTTNVTINTID